MNYAIAKRTVTYKQQNSIVFDVWTMIGNKWQIAALAISPAMIKEFFNIEII